MFIEHFTVCQGQTLRNQKGSVTDCNFVLWGMWNRKPGRGLALSCSPHLCTCAYFLGFSGQKIEPITRFRMSVQWHHVSLCALFSSHARGLFSVQTAAQCALRSQLWPCEASCLVIYANWRPSLHALFRCMCALSLFIWGFKWAQGWQESPRERLQLACGAGAIRVGLIACLVTFLWNSCPPTNVRPKGLALEFW